MAAYSRHRKAKQPASMPATKNPIFRDRPGDCGVVEVVPEQVEVNGSGGATAELLRVTNLQKYFPIRRGLFQRRVGWVRAVDGVSFSLWEGETLGLVGESGCGKSTTGRAILQLQRPTQGSVEFEGKDLTKVEGPALRKLRGKMQMIFQDPHGSLNPRLPIGSAIGEPLKLQRLAKGRQKEERIRELLNVVGLNPQFASRYPHEFSGGQRQRISIARALAAEPTFIVCDEPISALDVSIQAQVINLLQDLQEKYQLTYLFISHDLSVVRHLCDRVAVMYLGKIVESGSRDSLYERPMHPYTMALMSAIPIPDPSIERHRERIILAGDVPSASKPPQGCAFHPRCWLRRHVADPDRCVIEEPKLRQVRPGGHVTACHFAEELPDANPVLAAGDGRGHAGGKRER